MFIPFLLFLDVFRFFDLIQSCDISDSGDLSNCKCKNAERLIDNGQINCDTDHCPSDCEICEICLVDVLQTDCYSPIPTVPPSLSPSFSPFDISDCSSYSNKWYVDIYDFFPLFVLLLAGGQCLTFLPFSYLFLLF